MVCLVAFYSTVLCTQELYYISLQSYLFLESDDVSDEDVATHQENQNDEDEDDDSDSDSEEENYPIEWRRLARREKVSLLLKMVKNSIGELILNEYNLAKTLIFILRPLSFRNFICGQQEYYFICSLINMLAK